MTKVDISLDHSIGSAIQIIEIGIKDSALEPNHYVEYWGMVHYLYLDNVEGLCGEIAKSRKNSRAKLVQTSKEIWPNVYIGTSINEGTYIGPTLGAIIEEPNREDQESTILKVTDLENGVTSPAGPFGKHEAFITSYIRQLRDAKVFDKILNYLSKNPIKCKEFLKGSEKNFNKNLEVMLELLSGKTRSVRAYPVNLNRKDTAYNFEC